MHKLLYSAIVDNMAAAITVLRTTTTQTRKDSTIEIRILASAKDNDQCYDTPTVSPPIQAANVDTDIALTARVGHIVYTATEDDIGLFYCQFHS